MKENPADLVTTLSVRPLRSLPPPAGRLAEVAVARSRQMFKTRRERCRRDVTMTGDSSPIDDPEQGSTDIIGHESSTDELGHESSTDIIGHESSTDELGHESSTDIIGHESSTDELRPDSG